jgi:hypothetical protein
LFGDRRSLRFYAKTCHEIARGELRAESVAGCVRSARGANSPKKAFTANVGRCKRPAEAADPPPGPSARRAVRSSKGTILWFGSDEEI